MAQLIIDIPDNEVNRILTAVCSVKGYDASSGLTRVQFTKRYVANHIKDVVRFYEREEAKNAAFNSIVDVDPS